MPYRILERGPRRSFVVGAAASAVTAVLFLLWIVLGIGGARVADGFDDVGELVAAVVAAVLCALAARRTSCHRRSWVLVALSSLTWAAGEAVWTFEDLIRGVRLPFPSPADAFFVAAIPLMIGGLVLFPQASPRTAHRVQGILDGCIVAAALLYASWATILGPIYRAHRGSVLKQVLTLTYPASDVVMLSLVVILIARSGLNRRTSMGLVMAGVAAFAVADSAFAYLTEVNKYNTTFLDTGWVVGFLLIGLGALWHLTSPATETVRTEESTMSLVAPYVPVLVVLAVTAVSLMRGTHIDSVAWGMALGLVTLVLGREALRIWDQQTSTRMRRGGRSGSGTALARR